MSFSHTLKRHGLKMGLTLFLGNLAVSMVVGTIVVIFLVIGGLIAFAGFINQFSPDMTDAELGQIFLEQSVGFLVALGIFILIIWVISLFAYAFQTAGSFSVMKEAITEDRSEIGTFFTKGFKFTWKTFLVLLLSHLPYIGVAIVAAFSILFFLMDNVAGYMLGGLVILIAGVLAVVVSLGVLHAPMIVVTENAGALKAFSLSFRLLRQAFGQVFLSGLFLMLINVGFFMVFFLFGMVLSIPLIGMGASGASEETMIIADIIIQLISMAVNFLVTPLIILLTFLLLTYRYYKYLRVYINPGATVGNSSADGSAQPTFSMKSPSSPSQASQTNDDSLSFKWEQTNEQNQSSNPQNDNNSNPDSNS